MKVKSKEGEMEYPKSKQWGLVGAAQSGKSSFIAANAKCPIFVVDADGRFDAVEAMLSGKVIYASRKARVRPLALQEELEEHGFDVESIVFDSISPMYSTHSRKASMRGNEYRTGEERKAAGLNANKASDMVSKADIMNVIGNATVYGADVFYIWHRNKGLDVEKMQKGQYKDLMVDKDSVSQVELDRLATSMNMLLHFYVENGVYKIRVESARDYNGRIANTGIVVEDYPGNFWKHGAERIMELVYAHFDGQQAALSWASDKLGKPADSLLDLYDDVKAGGKPKSSGHMWYLWVQRVHEELYGSGVPIKKSAPAQPSPQPTAVKPEPVAAPAPPPPPPPPEIPADAEGDFDHPDSEADFDQLPAAVPHVPEKGEDGHYRYGDDSVVGDKEEPYFLEYCKRVGRVPDDVGRLRNAVKASKKHGKPYQV